MNYTEDYYAGIKLCCQRYRAMLETKSGEFTPNEEDLYLFIDQLLVACLHEEPLMKMNRWLGYIQGVMIALEYTTIRAEREFTRPLFRPLDYPK